MTPLRQILDAGIAATGPISVAQYMEVCLGHPEHGYYVTRDPFGVQGDFTTAPEISQMFGEMLGAWLAQVWLDQGAPDRFVLAELGPGRGTLMKDVLRVLSRVEGCLEAASICLVETSPVLRRMQREALPDVNVTWKDRFDGLPDGPLYLLANEFFDALPVRQFQRVDAYWRERLVTSGDEGLEFAWSDPARNLDLENDFGLVGDGTLVEVCATGAAIAGALAQRIAANGGAALIVDYGAWDGTGDTFQALSDHSPIHPLASPGEADLTCHVRFRALAQVAGGAVRCQLASQGKFLEQLGIGTRAAALTDGKASNVAEQVVSAHRRLTHPDEMGNLFQVLAFTPETAPEPPGFLK